MPRTLMHLILALVAPSTGLAAQTVIVDKKGGGNFTEIADAVAKVSSGAVIRVRFYSGYLPFTLTNKSVTIIGEKDSRTGLYPRIWIPKIRNNTNRLTIGALAASHRVVFRNIALSVNAYMIGPPILVKDCKGAVVFENVEFNGGLNTFFNVDVTDCPNVHFSNCTFGGRATASKNNYVLLAWRSQISLSNSTITGRAASSSAIIPGSVGLLARASRVVAAGTQITGGKGGSAIFDGSDGGAAVVLQSGSTLVATGTKPNLFTGGGGGCGGLGKNANGGTGIVLTGGSMARIEGFAPAGGTPCPGGGKAGAPFTTDATSKLTLNPKSLPALARMTGAVTPGSTLNFWLDARPNSSALMILGQRPVWVDMGPAVVGILLARPDIVLGLPKVPAGGSLKVPVALPKTLPRGLTGFVQFASQEPGPGTVWGTNLLVVTVE
ncbi:MAG: hypothetical protein V3U11_12050 [Planctomycetota bacterium]